MSHMNIEITPEIYHEMIDLRKRIASEVTLTPQYLELNRRILNDSFEMYVQPMFAEANRKPLMADLSSLREHQKTSLPYSASARLLAAAFLIGTESENLFQLALEGIGCQDKLGIDKALHMFAHNFDIASGIFTAAHRFVIVEDELNGLTSDGIERRDQMARSIGIRLSAAELVDVHGESIFYARELAELVINDDSVIPGTKLFTDLITRVEEGQFVPGILPESFKELRF